MKGSKVLRQNASIRIQFFNLIAGLFILMLTTTLVSCSDDWNRDSLVEYEKVEVASVLPHGVVVDVKIDVSDKVVIKSQGLCWNKTGEPDTNDEIVLVGTESDSYSAQATGMSFDGTYYVRAFVHTTERIYYSDELEVKPAGVYDTGTFADSRDLKEYRWVRIFNQLWMAENLNYQTPSGSAAYNNDPANASQYGLLYTWEAANQACPTGWVLPDTEQWNLLIRNVGGGTIAGSELKHQGTEYWQYPNEGANNHGGFSALAGGFKGGDDTYRNLGAGGYFWSSTSAEETKAGFFGMYSDKTIVSQSDTIKTLGFSVRCIKVE
ncbi:MAG: hypothetical protein GX587_00425 [Bacteroidales bacterium]|nr:hypothetical protein [Bacteroidales bacterium]